MSEGLWTISGTPVRLVGPLKAASLYRITNTGPSSVNVGIKDSGTGKFTYFEARPSCSIDLETDGDEIWIHRMASGGSATGTYALVR